MSETMKTGVGDIHIGNSALYYSGVNKDKEPRKAQHGSKYIETIRGYRQNGERKNNKTDQRNMLS